MNSKAAIVLQSMSGMQPLILITFLMVRGAALTLSDLRTLTGKSADSLQAGLDSLCQKGWIVKQIGQHGRPSYAPGSSSFFDMLGQTPVFAESRNLEDEQIPEKPESAQNQIPVFAESGNLGAGQIPEKPESGILETGQTPVFAESGAEKVGQTPVFAESGTEISGSIINDDDDCISIDKSSSSITEPAQKFPTLASILQNLELLFGDSLQVEDVPANTSAELALGWVCKAYFDSRRAANPLNNPVGLIRARLNAQSPRRVCNLDMLPYAYLQALGLWAGSCPICNAAFGSKDELNNHLLNHEQQEDNETEINELPALPADDPAQMAWDTILIVLKEELPRASFQTWVNDLRIVSNESGIIQLVARNAYACEWLQNRLQQQFDGLFSDALDTPIKVKFIHGAK